MSFRALAYSNLLVTIALVICETSVQAADPYAGSKILPKVECLSIKTDTGPSATESDFEWPASVIKTEGQWLLITDDGRSNPEGRPSQGWVRKSNVILMAKDPLEPQFPTATDYFTAQIARTRAKVIIGQNPLSEARAFWLRGAAWQDSGDKDAARHDYECAIKCPGICNTSYEDEAYSGLADCLWQSMVRSSSAVFACRRGIDAFRAACDCPLTEPCVGCGVVEPECGGFECTGTDVNRFDDVKDWQREAKKAAESMKTVSRYFLVAISLKARPRTYAVWADALLVSNTQDVPFFGYFVLPSNLRCNATNDVLNCERPSHISTEKLRRTLQEICTPIGDALRCDCGPTSATRCICEAAGCGDVTIPLLCGRALAQCRTIERAYLSRCRYYAAVAQNVMYPFSKQVVEWRNSRNVAMKFLTDRETNDKSQLDKMRDYQRVLVEDLSVIQRLNSERLNVLKTDFTRDLSIALLETSREAKGNLPGMSKVPAKKSLDRTLGFVKVAGPVLVDFEERRFDRDYIKRCLRRLQFEGGDFRCSPSKIDFETSRRVCIDPHEPYPTDDNRINAAVEFHYYWNQAIRDANEALAVTSAKTRTGSLNTAYRLRASLLLMRIAPTGLQSVETCPNQLRTSVVDLLSAILPEDVIGSLKNIKVDADEVKAIRLIARKLIAKFERQIVDDLTNEINGDSQLLTLLPKHAAPHSLDDVSSILGLIKCCPGKNEKLKVLMRKEMEKLTTDFETLIIDELTNDLIMSTGGELTDLFKDFTNLMANQLRKTSWKVIVDALVGQKSDRDDASIRFIKKALKELPQVVKEFLRKRLPDADEETLSAMDTVKQFLAREMKKIDAFVNKDALNRWRLAFQNAPEDQLKWSPTLQSIESAAIEPLIRNLPKWSRVVRRFGDAVEFRSDDQTLVEVLDLLFGSASRPEIASRLSGIETCNKQPDLLQDSEFASQAEAAAAQAAKLSQFKGQEGLTLWGVSLAATGDYSNAIRRLTTAVGQLPVDQQPQVLALMQAICAAKLASEKSDFSCSSSSKPTPTAPAACKPCNLDIQFSLAH